jgi:predicted nucleotidyltransferase
MAKKPTKAVPYRQPYRYASPDIPMSAIRRFARQIAERFHPEKIILFGSYAYGKPHVESDVDLLVIMPARNVIDQAVRIDQAFEAPFSLDLIVRTPKQIEIGLREDDCDWFLHEIIEKGKVLYEAEDGAMGPQSGRRLARRHRHGRAKTASPRSSLLSLSANRRKIPQGFAAGIRRGHSKNA